MAVTGKNSLTIRKRDLENEKTIAVGFSKLQAWHKADAGETGIDLLALNFPTELTGVTNPSNSKLAKAQLRKYAANITITSSLSGKLMRQLSWTAPNATRINWVGFTSLQDEIFEITVDYSASNELTVVDGKPLVVTGTLAAGQTDIPVGQPFEAGKFIDQQTGAVQVFIDGVQQFRNTNNQASPQDGNYYEVNSGGISNLIRMNTSSTSDRDFLILSNGVIAERPIVSQQADIEKVQGQVDAMIPDLAQAVGNPESNYQAAPNNIDLKTFGDRVVQTEIDLEAILATELETSKIAYLKDVKPNNTTGGGATAGSWFNRVLNTLEGDTSFISLAANQFTLQPGTYQIEGSVPARAVNSHKSKVRDITNGVDVIIGQTCLAGGAESNVTHGSFMGTFSITAPTTFAIQQRVQSNQGSGGLGWPSNLGVIEVYTQAKITKIETQTLAEQLGL